LEEALRKIETAALLDHGFDEKDVRQWQRPAQAGQGCRPGDEKAIGLLTVHDPMGLFCSMAASCKHILPDKLKLEVRAFAHTAISSFDELISHLWLKKFNSRLIIGGPGSFDVNHDAIVDLFTSVRKNTRAYWASGATFLPARRSSHSSHDCQGDL
jgi:hypothetical protein